jgi:demethylmenaquinone methyltransferase / 2-methoxy-6-polyprenyl-1,4-benzoquinol methylase
MLVDRNVMGDRRIMDKDSQTTHFGFATVEAGDKARRVREVFDSVADRYDLMNDLMSGGLHRWWKRFTVEQAAVRRGQRVLDLAGGSGDLALAFARQVGHSGYVILADINSAMLAKGRARLIDAGVAGNFAVAEVDAEQIPFADRTFDCVSIAFGLRNVTHQSRALRSMHRVLKPGGKALILEFSKPREAIQPAYDWYSFRVLPALGKLVANDAASYRYLAESIRMHPDQESLLEMMRESGFERCRYHNLSGGIVALHVGYRL